MSTRPTEIDQSDRPAHPWSISEPGSWAELAESTAFVVRAGGRACHPLSLAICLGAALLASWALPIRLEALLPWLGEQGWGATVWAWARLAWLVLVSCLAGVVLCRIAAARASQAAIWNVLGPMLASAGLCVSTFVATLLGAMLASWMVAALGGWLDNAFGATLAGLIAFVAFLGVALATVLLLLAIPAIAANDADAPDAIQRAAAHIIARPGLTLALVLLVVAAVALVVWASIWAFRLAYATVAGGWEDPQGLVWLPSTIALALVLAAGWAGLTHALLTLREVVDREDRASCWDPRAQAEAIRAAVEARERLARDLRGEPAESGSESAAERGPASAAATEPGRSAGA
ncbi:MAG: hypothetical protein RIB58_12825 [Phycisphaerales bacterium]